MEMVMRTKWRFIIIFTLLLMIVLVSVACVSTSPVVSTSPIVGYWQAIEEEDEHIEFSNDGMVIFEDATNIMSGTYELIDDNYVKVKFEGFRGFYISLFGADTWKYQISGDTMILQIKDDSGTYKRIR